MAAAYAAIVSALHIVYKIQHHHASHIKSLGENPLVEALRKRACSLQDFLESYDCGHGDKDAERLESRIAEAAYAAEDVLESHIVDRIHAIYNSSISYDEETISIGFDQNLEKVIQDMDHLIIEKEVKKIKLKEAATTKEPTSSLAPPSSKSTPPPRPTHGKNATSTCMVGFDEYLTQITEKLTGQGLGRQVIPIYGMGGIGKTTLAKNVHMHPFIVEYFDRRAFVTISQTYSIREILLGLLGEIRVSGGGSWENHELGEKLYKELCGRMYLIVLDDMWSVEVWDEVKLYFPNDENGSRVMVTTRIVNLASDVGSWGLKIDFLDDSKSLKLLCQRVFGGDSDCPNDEFEKLGEKIASKCKGLPLSIATIGGLLAQSPKTLEYWNYVLENLNSILTLDDDEFCFRILSLSYSHLPVHLKPCFLYMGILREDQEIVAQKLVRLWVAEGFLKPIKGKSLEEVAKYNLKDLVDRNLIILVNVWSSCGKIEKCSIHDLLRDLCLRETQKDKFLFIPNVNDQNIEAQRRLAMVGLVQDFERASRVRSFTITYNRKVSLPSPTYRLLRVSARDSYITNEVFEYVNLRYVEFELELPLEIPSSIGLLWNLETLIIHEMDDYPLHIPIQIWGMRQLRHFIIWSSAILPDPPIGSDYNSVLENLETMKYVRYFKLTEDIIRTIPNLKEFAIECFPQDHTNAEGISCCAVANLDHLHKLESLDMRLSKCSHPLRDNWQQIKFPRFLKNLILYGGGLPWESMTIIGSLPHLEAFEICYDAFKGDEWNAIEGEFLSLKYLEIDRCPLRCWNADEACFPHLERLVIWCMRDLVEIPLGIGEIPTLESIDLKVWHPKLYDSAKEILKQQRSFGNESLQVFTDNGPMTLDASCDESLDESLNE